ncbi:hypothetical protein LSPCS325_09030 [Lysinibacillus sp. CTST325]
MKKWVFEWAILIWTSLLVLLITGWVMIEFYDWKDTIVAAIIAFVGAVIGGSITLIGVNLTIHNSRLDAKRKEAKLEYIKLHQLSKMLDKLCAEVSFNRMEERYEIGEIVNKLIKRISVESDIFLISLESIEIHSLIIEFDEYLEFLSERYYYEGEVDGMSDHDIFFDMLKKFKFLEDEIKTRILELKKYLN